MALDLSKVRHMNSYALSALIALLPDHQEQGLILRVFGAKGTVLKLMMLPGEANPIEVCDDEEQATRTA